jgi:hypothetical protein
MTLISIAAIYNQPQNFYFGLTWRFVEMLKRTAKGTKIDEVNLPAALFWLSLFNP